MPFRRLFGLSVFALLLLSSPVLAQTVSFIDEDGASASSYLEFTRVYVRVEDPAANTSPGPDTVPVALSAALSGDSEVLSLTETGPGTGVFEGGMYIARSSPSVPANGYVETWLQVGPPVVRETLTVQYAPSITDTAVLAGARIQLLDEYGRPAAGYTEGDWVTVRVEDYVNYNDPYLRDGVTVAVNVLAVSDEEFIVLQETGENTYVYEGRIPAALYATYDNDGIVGAPVGNLVHAQYALSDAQETVDVEAPLVGSRAEILDNEGDPAEFVAESSTIRLRAVDRTVGGPGLVDTVQAEASSEIGLDEETVTLTETGVSTGVFEADLPTSIDSTLPGNGVLETAEDAGPPHRFDTITLNYSGASDSVVTYGSETLFIDAFGNDAEAYSDGSIVYVRVIDYNFDDSGARDTVTATVLSHTTGDAEIITLTETGSHTAVFEGSLPIELQNYSAVIGDGQLQGPAGQTIEARHTDALGNTASGDLAVMRYTQVEFIDEQGRPTHELLEGGYALIRLYSAGENYASYAVDNATVTVSSLETADEETVQLQETGPDTGIFEGSVRLNYWQYGAIPGNSMVETSIGGESQEQDTITVEAMDDLATATTIGARIRLIDSFGQDAASYAAGELVGVRVEDHNVDDPYVRQTLQVVIVVNDESVDVESVNALETGYSTGVFEGWVPTRHGSPASENGTLDVQGGDLLQARHSWLHAPRMSTDDALVTHSAVHFVDAEGDPAESYLEASTARVRLVFGEGNASPYTVDTVSVTVSAAISQDSEALTLTETGADTGIFTGSIPLRTGTPSTGDGLLQTGRITSPSVELDTLTVTHVTGYGSSSDTVAIAGSRTWFVDAYGNPAESYARDSRAYIRVEDHAFNQPGVYDTVQVTLRSLGTGDQETLTLLETARDSGIFAGSMALDSALNSATYPNPGDGQLQSDAVEEIEAVHTDWNGDSTSSDRALIHYGSIEIVDEAGEVTFEVLENGLLRLRVFEPSDPYGSSTINVSVRSLYGDDVESVTLNQTQYGSPVYEGTVQLHAVPPGSGVTFNGTFEASNSGSPEYRPEQVTAELGYSSATATVLGSRARFIDLFGRVVSSFAAGDRVGVRVQDHNLADPLVRRTVPVIVRSQAGDVETVTLTETAFDSNVYEGSVASGTGFIAGNDGVLQVQSGLTIEAEHSNVYTPAETVVQAMITGASVLFVDEDGDPADTYLESSRAWVRVADASASGTVSVTLRTALGPDLETLVLTETGPSSGVFTGSIKLVVSTLSPEDGALTTVQDAGSPHEFDTLRAEYNGAVDTAGTVSSRTWFVDAYGNPTDSYARDSRAYVRVEDHTFDQPGVYDTVQVTLHSLDTGDQETLTLLETARDSGIFAGSMPLDAALNTVTTPNPGDGQLQADAVGAIEAVHTDWTGSTVSSDQALIYYASVEIVDEAGEVTFEVLENGLLRLRVFDPYDPYGNSTTSVVVRSLYGEDVESITLTRTQYGSPVYEGTVQLHTVPPGGGITFNGTFEVSNSGSPEYWQEQVTVSNGNDEATATVLGSRARFIDLFGRVVSSFAAGDRVGVRVEDHSLDDPLVRRTVTVAVRSQIGDLEGVTLTETAFDSNVYEGSTASGTGTPSVNDGVLQVQSGLTIEAEHSNVYTPAETVVQAMITGASVLFVDEDGDPADTYLESSRAWVRVADASASGTVSVTLRTALGPDVETLVLDETGPSSGVFLGSIKLVVSTLSPENGALTTVQDAGTPHEFDTLRVEYNGAIDTAGTVSSRTWFVDAYGNPTDSYARDSRAYVRVEDHTFDQPGVYDTVQVTLRSLDTGDQETLTLLETARDSGIFAGSMALDSAINTVTTPNPGDGQLQADAVGAIEAVHTDWTGSTVSSDQAFIYYGSIEIVDEAGEVTFEVLENGLLRLRAFEPYNPYGNNTTSVSIQSLYGEDVESVTLTQTQYGSPVYEGTVQLHTVPPGGGITSNGTFETSNSGSPEYWPEQVTASNGQDEATATVLGSRIEFIDLFGRVVSSFAAGDRVGVRVQDHNLADPLVRRTVPVIVRSQAGDTETVTLTETAFDSNVYEGSVASGTGTPSGNDGVLQVQSGLTIEAEHSNVYTPAETVVQAMITGASVLFVDEGGDPADTYLESSRAWVRVADASASGTVSVTLRTTLGPDVETLVLNETGPSSGLFTGSIKLVVSTLSPENGVLTTVQDAGTPHEFDTLRVEYNGAVDTAGTLSSRTWFVDAYGNLIDSYARDSRAYVRVEDHTFDQPGVYDTVQVTLRSLGTGDQETLTLLETERDSGIFAGSMALDSAINTMTTPNPGDGQLQSDAVEEIEAVHTDWTGSTVSSDRAFIYYGSIEIVDEAGEVTFEVLENGLLRLRAFEPYNPYGNSTISVSIQSLYGDDAESVTLTQTQYGSPVYEGTVQLHTVPPGGGVTFNGTFETSNSGSPEYWPEQVTASNGYDEATATVLGSRIEFIDLFGRVVSSFAAGDRVGVRVQDHNLADPLVRRTVPVIVGSQTGDSETVTLTETAFDSNVYEGSVASGTGTPSGNDGVLQVQSGLTIDAEHSNVYTPAETVVQALITGASVLFVDEGGDPADTYLESGRAWVRVADPSASGTVSVTLRTALGPDVETLVLNETGPSSGVFLGSIKLVVSTLSPEDGVLTTVQDAGTPHEFDTLRVEYNGAIDTAGTVSSRTWFVDAYGNLIDSYARDSRAYLRVEDHTFDQPGVYDTVQVTLRSLGTGDQETLTLLETARDSGIFAGSMALDSAINTMTTPNPGDGQLQSDAVEEIESVHTDWTGSTVSSDRAFIYYGGIEIVDEAGAVTFEVLENGLLRLRAFDPYNPYGYSTISVSIQSLYGDDAESVTLTQKEYGSPVYEGTVQLHTVPPGGGVTFNGTFETSNSGSPEYWPEQVTASNGYDEATAMVLGSRIEFIDLFGRVVSSFAVGDRVGVRVQDHNLADPLVRRTVPVIVRSQTGDSETVTLTETAFDSNVYEGSVASGTGTPSGNDGILQVQSGLTIEAEHSNVYTPAETMVQAMIVGAAVLFVDENGDPADLYLEGSRAWVRVFDASAAGTVSATLRTALGPDVETLVLTETGPSSGVFTGSIDLVVSTLSPNDGALTTVQDAGTPHEFDTLRVEYNGAVDTAGTISSRTWFVDSYGNLTDSFSRSSRAYVRVEDHTSDTVQVTLRSLATGDQETITLQETATDSGIFEGSLPLEAALVGLTNPNPGDGKLQSDAVEEIEVTHTDWTGSTESSDRAFIYYGGIEIVDEAGAVTFELLENGTARLRAFDPYPYGTSTVSVTVRSQYAGDGESIELTQTQPGGLVYEATVQLHTVPPGGGITSNGTFETSNSGSPEYRPEQVTAEYGYDTAMATVVASRVLFLDLQGQVVEEYAVGSEVRVRVEDHSAGNAGQVDSVSVALSTPGDNETVSLTETGAATGIFEGSIPSSATPGAAQDGTLSASPFAVITAEHSNIYTPSPTVGQAAFTGNFAPLAADDSAETVEEEPVTIAVLANDTDPDSEPLQVASVTQGANGSVTINGDGTVTYTPVAEFAGTDTFSYIAADPRGGRDRAMVTVTVIQANAAPVGVDDTATTPEDQAVNIAVLANDTDPDDDPLNVRSVGVPSMGTAVIEPDDTITYTPEPNWSGQATFTYMVEDPAGLMDYATVTITVTPVNDPPVANDDTFTVAEDGSDFVFVKDNDLDAENDTLDIVSVTQGAHGTVTLNEYDDVVYAPNANYHGADSFTYTISDGGGTDTATVSVTVTPVADSPIAVDDTATTDEDTAVTITVAANDTDPDGDTLEVYQVTAPTNGVPVLNADDTVTFTPYPGFHGTASFSYAVRDGNGGTDWGQVTVTVNSVNDLPVAVDDTSVTEEDSSVTVLVLDNDSDADDDTLTVTAVTQGANGAVTLDPVTYTPNANFHGTDSFTYTVSDGNGGTDTATVSVTINGANDAPVAGDDSSTVAEDGSVTVNVLGNDTDADNDTLTVTAVTQGTNGTVTLNPVTYTPNANFHGADSFTYTVSDGNGGTDTATVNVTITSVNDAPVAVDDTASVVEDGSVTVNVLGNDSDVDNDTLTVTAVTQGTNGTVTLDPVTYTPAPNFFGTDSFTYTIGDGNGGVDTATVTVTVAPSNDALTASDDSATVDEDGSVTVAVLANDSDPENDVLSVQSVTQGTNGSVAIVGTQVTYTPNADFHGADSFTYTATDGNGGIDSATVTITVNPVNDDPAAGDDTASVVEDGSVDVTVLGNDADVDEDLLSVTSVTQGTHGTVVINGDDTVTYTPEANYNGTDSFTYTISDGSGGEDTATVTVTVGAANDAPVANDDSASTSEDNAVTVTVLGNDTDLENDTLSVSAVTQGANGAVVINANNTVTYTPAANFNGSDSFTYTASDGNGGTDTATVNVTVTAVNDAPVANDDPASVAEDGSVTVNVLGNDTDVENDTLTVTSVTQGAHGAVTLNPVTYTPNANYNGADSFTYTISDGNGGEDTATVTVTVGAANDAPAANDDTATVAEDGSVTVSVLGNDTDLDNDTLTVTAVTQGANGTVTLNPVTYTPNPNFFGTDSFTYTASDGNGGTDTATVNVTVTAVNDAPVAVNDSASTVAETPVTIQVRNNDTDVEGNTLTITAVTQGAHGTVAINSGQTVTYTPATAWIGPDSFTYTISDGAGGTSTATVNVNVNAPPRVSTNIQVLYTFNEGSGTTVNDVSGVGSPLNLTVANAGAVTWLPGALSINSNTLVQTAGTATKVINACKSSNEVTMEAWVDPLNLTQTGPAAIVTISQTNNKRDVTLGQSGTAYNGQLRTSTTGQDGTQHNTGAVANLNLTHVVYTRSSTGAVRIYVNGTQVATGTLTGNFSSWANYNLALGGELSGTRYWRGEMHLVAIYSRALTAAEVRQNWLAGAN